MAHRRLLHPPPPPLSSQLQKKFPTKKTFTSLRIKKLPVLDFCPPSPLSLQLELQSSAKKHISEQFSMWRKFCNFAIQAINSENDQQI